MLSGVFYGNLLLQIFNWQDMLDFECRNPLWG